MLKEIKVLRGCEIVADNIFINNGFILERIDTIEQINKIRSLGIKSSPSNSCRIWHKDNKKYLFSNWESDDLGRAKFDAKYIVAIDITDLL